MRDTLTAVVEQLAGQIRGLPGMSGSSTEGLETLLVRVLAPHFPDQVEASLPFCPVMDWSESIQAFRELLNACVHAEADTENAGLIRVLCELVLATHRVGVASELATAAMVKRYDELRPSRQPNN
jgi:hypothetical protein